MEKGLIKDIENSDSNSTHSTISDTYFDEQYSSIIQETIHMRAHIDHENCKKQIKELEHIKNIKKELATLQEDLNFQKIKKNELFPFQDEKIFHETIQNNIQNTIDYISNATNCDNFTAILLLLFSISAASRGKYIAKINSDWEEPITLFLAICTESKDIKEKLFNLIMRPHEIFEEKKQNEYQEWNSTQIDSDNIKKVKAFIRRMSIKKHGGNIGITPESLILFANNIKNDDKIIEEVFGISKKRNLPSLTTDHTSFKKLYDHMHKNGDGCTFFSDSGCSFMQLISQNKAPLDIFSKSYNFKNFSYTTRGEEVLLQKPFMNILLATTPDILRQIYSSTKINFHDLTPKFMVYFYKPDYPLVTEQFKTPQDISDSDNSLHYENQIKRILENCYTQSTPREIKFIEFENSAKHLLMDLPQTIESAQSYFPSGDARYRAYSRLKPGMIARISALLHIWRHIDPEKYAVSKNDILLAEYIVNRLVLHAKYAIHPSGLQAYYDSQKIVEWIIRHRCNAFNSTQLARGISGMTNKNIFPALDTLERLNVIRQLILPDKPRLCVCHKDIFSLASARL